MSREFFIADTHFGDKSVLNPNNKPRPFPSLDAMAETIKRNWNEIVADDDIVWMLGDVGKDYHHFRDLKGKIKLVGGNWDGAVMRDLFDIFEEVHGCKYLKGLLLTHIPVHPSQVGQYLANVHGHLHSGFVQHDRYLCVSVDQTGFRPITKEKVFYMLNRGWPRRYPMPEPTVRERVRAVA